MSSGIKVLLCAALLLIPSFAHTFRVCWLPPTQNVDGTDITDYPLSYRVYWGASSRSYSEARQISSYAVDLSNPDGFCSNIKTTPGEYYVAMTAVDASGDESAYSNEVRKTETRGLPTPEGGRRLDTPTGGRIITDE